MLHKYIKSVLLVLAIVPWNSRLASQIRINIVDGVPNATIAIVNPDYYLFTTPLYQSKISENGKGLLVYQIEKSQIIVVDVGNRKTVKLLIAPEESYDIIIAEENIQFKGHNSPINKVLYENRILTSNFKFNNKSFIKWNLGEEFNTGITLLEKALQKNLNTLTTISDEDSFQITSDMNFYLLAMKLGSFLSKNTDFSSETILSEYDEIMKQVPLDNAYYDFISYKSVLNQYANLLNNYYILTRINNAKNNISGQDLSQSEFIINENSPQKISDYLLTDYFLSKISSLEDLSGTYKKFSNHISNLGYKEIIKNRIKANSQPSEFNIYQESYFSNINKKVLLKDSIPGSLIYMDIWATWCGPCIKEFKYSKELPTQLKDMKDLKFVYASIDIDEDKWLNFLSTKNPPLGTHINLNKEETSTLFQELNINGVPRYIIINREGIIVDEDAPAPSDPKLREILLKHYQ